MMTEHIRVKEIIRYEQDWSTIEARVPSPEVRAHWHSMHGFV